MANNEESEKERSENNEKSLENDEESEKERSENKEENLEHDKESEKGKQDRRKKKYGLMGLPTASTSLKTQPAVTPKIFSENGAN